MKRVLSVIALMLIIASVIGRTVVTMPNYVGQWVQIVKKQKIILHLKANNSYLWLSRKGKKVLKKEKGKYAVRGNHIWLLGQNRIGTKWQIMVSIKSLSLIKPEDFRYLGRGRYIYFQITNPAITFFFKRK